MSADKTTKTLSRRAVLRAGAATGALMALPASVVASESEPYTDIQLVDAGPGEVTLKYINNTGYTYAFDHRVDGESGDTHQWSDQTISQGPCAGRKWGPYYNLTSVGPNSTKELTIAATHKVEAQAVLGPEQNYHTCWKTFYPEQPETKSDCKGGGWDDYHFRNQGQCIRYVETGKDSR